MFRLSQIAVVLAVTLLVPLAQAQKSNPYLTGGFTPSFPNTPPENIHRHSSTIAEGYLRGRAALVQAKANAKLQDSQASVVRGHAESLAYDNYLKRTATALARKATLQHYRDQQRQYDKIRRSAAQEEMKGRLYDLAETYRLADSDFDWETGEISWPQKLTAVRYTKHRQAIEQILGEVTRYGIRTDCFYRDELVKVTKRFRNQLWEDYRSALAKGFSLSRKEYLGLQKFVLSLKYTPELLEVTTSLAIAMN